ncbi:DUF2971 domain-containing protein [Mucilaginibacter sp. ZT4R22]|uniref:DUF2971 domain-containing protein n=1 Tax=Mucilaginibacter pankratovii TaxID=2772110 RepID=A0ABR7WQN7_9SPHI|nr:DUF2971 domain-containing protein [Mucilaginibacter pankratovii]MBD1363649.1 DUF2971 domain-containing protein [Mucilaginibacter pankratovii]
MNQSDQVRLDDLLHVAKLDYLYKYTSAENGILLLENNKIHFNSPLKFNDPFDCHPLLIKISDQYIYNTLKQGEYKNVLNRKGFTTSPFYLNFVKDFGKTQVQVINAKILPKVKISCFSERKNNLLMWAHYAKDHTGVCFEFDTKQMIRYLATLSKVSNDSTGMFLRVLYNHKRTNYPFESSNDPFPLIMWMKTKSIDWEYEREIRLVFTKREENLLAIPSELISKMYLGSEISNIHEAQIVRLCQANFPKTAIYKMDLSDREFQLVEQRYNSSALSDV